MNVVLDGVDYPVLDLTLDKYNFFKDVDKLGDPQVISLFTGIPVDDVKQAPFPDVKFVANLLRTQVIQDQNNSPLELTYTFKGKNYGLIIPSKISFEEWINLEVFTSKKPMDLPLIAAHLYKPLVEGTSGETRKLQPYSLEECQERANGDFKEFPLKVFMSAFFFLTTFATEYIKLTLSSMEMKQTESKYDNPTHQRRQHNWQ